MKPWVSLSIKLMVPLVILIILTVSLSGYRVYQRSDQRLQAEMDTRLERVASLVASTVDTAALQSIRVPEDINGPAYLKIQQQLEQALTAGNLAWVGIYYRDEGYFYYWVDYDFTGVGYPFFYPTAAHVAAYEDKQAHRVEYTDEFGSYYGFVAPILVPDPTGGAESQVIGLVEASVALEARELLRQEALTSVLPILGGGSLVSAAILAFITGLLFNRPLRRLRQGALTLAGGQFGHTIDLHSRDELGDLADAFNQMSVQLEKLYRERAESERVQRELEIARNVQQALFPSELPQLAGLEIAAICRPHRETSGDFYDLLPLKEDQVGVVIGDVSGKSIPAALLMVAAYSVIHSEASDHTSPAQVLNEANAILCRNIPRNMFVAASYARLDARQQCLVWANAGQVYPFLLHRVRPADPEAYPRYLETTGNTLPLGLVTTEGYSEQSLPLYPGDTVLFFTDGVVEAMNPARELYGFGRLEALVRSLDNDLTPQALIDAVLADLANFVGAAEQHDDITLVAVKLTKG